MRPKPRIRMRLPRSGQGRRARSGGRAASAVSSAFFKGKGLVAGVIEPTQAVGLQGGHSRVQQPAADERIRLRGVQRGRERQIVRGGADGPARAGRASAG